MSEGAVSTKRKTHCVHGHKFKSDAKWHLNSKGYLCRRCSECERLRMQRYRTDPERKKSDAARSARYRERNPEKYKATYQADFAKKKQILWEARAGGCVKCGEPHIACLDFHHRDPTTKEGHIGEFRKFGMKRLLAEIAKCDVLCANCHRKHHYDERQDSEGDEG